MKKEIGLITNMNGKLTEKWFDLKLAKCLKSDINSEELYLTRKKNVVIRRDNLFYLADERDAAEWVLLNVGLDEHVLRSFFVDVLDDDDYVFKKVVEYIKMFEI